jgi:tRNA threonylcarbamoyladenosine modification (KEOPS) complex Cgi121 subunit
MRFAATTQISQAINKVGIKKRKNFFIIAIGKKVFLNKLYLHLKQFLSKKPYSKNNQEFLKKKFKISKKQLDIVVSKNPLEDLLTEKAAILA